MADVQEVPLSAIPEDTQEPDTDIIEDTETQAAETAQEEIIATPKPKAKAKMGRPPGAKDAKPRAKPKPKAKIQRQISRAITQQYEESDDSESSADEATIQELSALQLMRSIRQYDQGRAQRKQQKYASWFGR